MRQKWDVEKGFSLMELLVVIAIIAILASLLLAALSRAKGQAHATACKNLLRQMGMGLQMYVDENQGKFPYYRGKPDASLNDSVGEQYTVCWWAKLLPYYPVKWTNLAYHCPGYKGAIDLRTTQTSTLGSYAYNAFGVSKGRDLGLGGRVLSRFGSRLTSELQLQAPSEMFAIGESRWRYQGKNREEGGHDFMLCGYINVNRGAEAFDPSRHGKNYNQLFCDGHVSAMSPWVLFNPTNTAAMWNNDHQPHSEFWPEF